QTEGVLGILGEDRTEGLLCFGYLAEPQESGSCGPAEIRGSLACRNRLEKGQSLLDLPLAQQCSGLDVDSLPVLRLLSEDERRLRLRVLPRSDLDRDAAQVDGERQGIRRQLLGTLELPERIAVPGFGGVGTAKPLDRRHEVLVDLQGTPELNDCLVGLPF